ncbi:cytoplasmic protein [Achromatium sp. WMS3]|nr:cytoplasmic protein [Achromatium sp. WMS3]
MHIISKKLFAEAAMKYPKDKEKIMDVYSVLNKGNFDTPNIMKNTFASLDNFKYKDKWWVIDIGGHNLRLIAAILFSCQKIYVKHIVTHSEYDKLCTKYRKGEL